MQTFLFTAGVSSAQLTDLETRLRAKLPDLQTISRIEDLTKSLPKPASGSERSCILFPVAANTQFSFDRIVNIAMQYRDSVFFIFISDDIPASDYKRLVQTGGADWATTAEAPQEVIDILARQKRTDTQPNAQAVKPAIAAFLPSAGGVGNATIAIETGIRIKTTKATRDRRACLLDLDFQTSHVCDYLDIQPRMHIEEIATTPERLDEHLFDIFLSHHGSGLDVLAAPRSKTMPLDVNIEALETLFRMVASRYDLVLLDLPVPWSSWTRQIVAIADAVFVTGLNTIPGMRQVAETLAAARSVEPVPVQIAVILNRCEHRLLGGIARRHHVKGVLSAEQVFYVREDAEKAVQSANTGIPMSASGQSNRVSKDIAPIAALVADLKPASGRS